MNLSEFKNYMQNRPWAIQDLRYKEYELLRQFINQTKPSKICVLGGYTNIDLFYACQDSHVDIINYDQCHDTAMMQTAHSKYKRDFDFQGTYHWYRETIASINEIESCDLLIIAGHQDIIYEIKDMPEHLILYHYGKMWLGENIMHIHHKLSLTCLSNRLALHTNKNINLKNSNYTLEQHRNFFDVTPVTMMQS
tara:strand:+ start:3408 stop:3989 length:582 start_codon:yes stop_codon:yes gene_type:complete